MARKKYANLLEENKACKADVQNVGQLREEDARIRREVEEEFREQIRVLKEEVQSSSAASEKAEKTAECVLSRPIAFSPPTDYVLPGVPLCIPSHIWTLGLGSRFTNLYEPEPLNLNVLLVRFRFGEALNLNQTERTVQVGLGSGLEILLNRTEPNRGNPRGARYKVKGLYIL